MQDYSAQTRLKESTMASTTRREHGDNNRTNSLTCRHGAKNSLSLSSCQSRLGQTRTLIMLFGTVKLKGSE